MSNYQAKILALSWMDIHGRQREYPRVDLNQRTVYCTDRMIKLWEFGPQNTVLHKDSGIREDVSRWDDAQT